jgi:hypothetical protein
MAVSTSCSLPDNIISMAHASASSTGLPRILPSSTTAVSAPARKTPRRRRARATGLGLAARQALDIGRRRFFGKRGFIDVRADGGERHADLREQFTPARRARGEVKRLHQDISLSSAGTCLTESIDFVASAQSTQSEADPWPEQGTDQCRQHQRQRWLAVAGQALSHS